MDVIKTANVIFSIPNKAIAKFTRLLYRRYEISNIGKFLADDIEYLRKLETELANRLEKINNRQPSKFLLESLISVLKECYEHLEVTRK